MKGYMKKDNFVRKLKLLPIEVAKKYIESFYPSTYIVNVRIVDNMVIVKVKEGTYTKDIWNIIVHKNLDYIQYKDHKIRDNFIDNIDCIYRNHNISVLMDDTI